MLTAQHCVSGNNFNVYMFNQFFGQRSYDSWAYDTASILNWYPANMVQLHWNNGYVVVKAGNTAGACSPSSKTYFVPVATVLAQSGLTLING